MRRFFGRLENGNIIIEGDEFNHLKNVLRLTVGTEVVVSTGDDYEYVCQIDTMQPAKKCAECKVIGQHLCEANPKKNIVLFQALPKKDKLEFIVQKATEIGVSRIVPFDSEYVIAKSTENKMDRLKSIAVNACKQCERTTIPQIDECVKIEDIIKEFPKFDVVLFANERTDKGIKIVDLHKFKNIAIIVGSEGGFSQKEKEKFIDAGATSISLGKRIYRCETASVVMMGMASILSEN